MQMYLVQYDRNYILMFNLYIVFGLMDFSSIFNNRTLIICMSRERRKFLTKGDYVNRGQ